MGGKSNRAWETSVALLPFVFARLDGWRVSSRKRKRNADPELSLRVRVAVPA